LGRIYKNENDADQLPRAFGPECREKRRNDATIGASGIFVVGS